MLQNTDMRTSTENAERRHREWCPTTSRQDRRTAPGPVAGVARNSPVQRGGGATRAARFICFKTAPRNRLGAARWRARSGRNPLGVAERLIDRVRDSLRAILGWLEEIAALQVMGEVLAHPVSDVERGWVGDRVASR